MKDLLIAANVSRKDAFLLRRWWSRHGHVYLARALDQSNRRRKRFSVWLQRSTSDQRTSQRDWQDLESEIAEEFAGLTEIDRRGVRGAGMRVFRRVAIPSDPQLARERRKQLRQLRGVSKKRGRPRKYGPKKPRASKLVEGVCAHCSMPFRRMTTKEVLTCGSSACTHALSAKTRRSAHSETEEERALREEKRQRRRAAYARKHPEAKPRKP